ncbi:hypothetical protein [uncultured Lamprocystis sp.]|jgi:hypothetical protein|uniref:hypothetical protein n=1 Tax=uncultured Lamprocystis sp. TaxID=543132 RepID=UPI0025D08F32|nr:hypothetical protein [uncultured Lamprocystis sp.]
MCDKQAAALIIENIAMLEDAMRLLNGELSESVFSAIDRTIEAWAAGMEWDGCFEFWTEDSGTSFGPGQWQTGEQRDWIAYFSIDVIDDDDEEWLTALLAARQSRIIFKFCFDRAQLPNATRRALNHFVRQINRKPEYAGIERAGFRFDRAEGSWHLPWTIDAKLLAETYVNDTIEDALEPVRKALEKINDVYPLFARIVESAREQFGANNDA